MKTLKIKMNFFIMVLFYDCKIYINLYAIYNDYYKRHSLSNIFSQVSIIFIMTLLFYLTTDSMNKLLFYLRKRK